MRKVWTLISSRRGRGIVAVCVLGLLGVGAVNLDHRTSTQRAGAWARSHVGSLPTTLEGLAAFPAEYRQQIFAELPITEQSRLWHVQLQSVLQTETLTEPQRAYVVKLMALATPDSFRKEMPKPEVCDDIARLFTNDAQRARVTRIAAGVEPTRSFAATWVKVSEKARAAVSLGAAQFDCNCRGLGLCECGLMSPCLEGDCNAASTCGCLWAGDCDKLCRSIILDMNRTTK
ncbi:MAG: bacteriocin fulvocin C-related protein [Planctomycetes bacterium]|nr:bacteriocin fulvocin C-related protein [Planctomycetota bacterium]